VDVAEVKSIRAGRPSTWQKKILTPTHLVVEIHRLLFSSASITLEAPERMDRLSYARVKKLWRWWDVLLRAAEAPAFRCLTTARFFCFIVALSDCDQKNFP